MTRPLRMGILGCARIARRGVIAGIAAAPSVELAALASRDVERARMWAAEFGVPRCHASYEALIDDPDVDAVYIPLPNELHRPWTLRAAAAGKHVLCEKPLALDAAEAKEMIAACQRVGVVLMEAFMWRHHPRIVHAQRMVAAGALGELRFVKMDFSFDIDRTDWRLDRARGGGALYDLGCYGINAARLFTGAEPVEIIARARMHSTGVDMTTSMLLRFLGDVVALLDCSFECPDRNRIEIVGTQGALELPDGVLPPPEARLVHTTSEGRAEIEFPRADQYAEEIEAFAAAIRTGGLAAPAEDGLANMRVLTQVRDIAWGAEGR